MRSICLCFGLLILFLPTASIAERETRSWGDWELRSSDVSCSLEWGNWRFKLTATYLEPLTLDTRGLGGETTLKIEPVLYFGNALNIYPTNTPLNIGVRLDDERNAREFSFERNTMFEGFNQLELLDSPISFLSEIEKGYELTLVYRGEDLVTVAQSGLSPALKAFTQCIRASK